MQKANPELLHKAIARSAAMVLSLPSAGMMRHCKSRFLSEENDGFWVESIPAERVLIEELLTTQHPVGVSFKNEDTKVVFLTNLSRYMPEFRINAQTVVPALMLQFPTELKEMQRRGSYRVTVPMDNSLSVRIWRIGPGVYLKDRPMAAQEIPTQVRDVSVGGLGVILTGKDGQPPRVASTDRLRIQLEYRDTSLLLEGQLHYAMAPNRCDVLRVGIQFKAPSNDIEGRHCLAKITRIVGELQREEVRRFWLGANKAV